MTPSIPRSCPGGKSWDKVAACLARFGKVTTLKTQPSVRLVQLIDDKGGFRISGLYLYTLDEGHWHVGGMLEGEDLHKLVAFERYKVGHSSGYRFDVSFSRPEDVMLDGQILHVHVRQKLAVFCSGQSQTCSPAVVACDVYVQGKSYWTFRGTLEIAAATRTILIRGDRSKTGGACEPPEEVFLPLVPEIDFE